MEKYILKDWSVFRACSVRVAPELAQSKLSGKVYGHSNFTDGTEITTSIISSSDGREVTSLSGNIYVLDGEPSPGYFKWCQENGYEIDPENPIKIRNL